MPSELWRQALRNPPEVREVAPDEMWGETGRASPGSDEMAVHGSEQEMLQRQDQAMSELRDMEFEMMGRLEDERIARDKQLKVLSQHSKKLDGQSAMLERILAGQRTLYGTVQELKARPPQMDSGHANSSSPAQPVTEPAEPQPVMEALHKIQAKMHEMQKSMEKLADDSAESSDEDEEVVEFGGLWYEGTNKHVISGKFLHDAAGEKSELEIYNERECNANCISLGHAHMVKDGQSLVWSSGRVWTRAQRKKRENLQEPDVERAASTLDVTRQSAKRWTDSMSQLGELTGIRSVFGDRLRDQCLCFDEGSMISRSLLRFAHFADWVDVQRRVPQARKRTIDRVVQSNYFEFVSATLITANAIYIGNTTSWFMANPLEEGTELMNLIDVVFVVLFVLELGLRAYSLRKMFFFGPDALWYCFDVVLVAVSLGELVVGSAGFFSFLRLLRVFKLSRVIRMVRTLRMFKELRLLLDCMLGSLNSLFWCLLMIAFVFYLFAVIMVQGLTDVLGDIERELSNAQLQREATGEMIKARWGSVSRGMLRLWEATTGGIDWDMEYKLVSLAGGSYSAVFIGFIAFMIIVVWNIVTSTILEKALRFAQPDIDQLLMDKRRRDQEDVEILLTLLQKAGMAVAHKITEEEFMLLLRHKDMAEFLQVRGIDIKEAHSFFALINEEGHSEGVDTLSLIAMCLRIKGFATSIDLHTVHYETMGILKRQGKLLTDTIRSIHNLKTTFQLQRDSVTASEASEILSPGVFLGVSRTSE